MTDSTLAKLRNNLERVRPYLDHRVFLATDGGVVEASTDLPQLNHECSRHDVKFLSACGAIEAMGDEPITSQGGKTRYRVVWRWDESTRQALLDYADRRTEMPRCDHGVHIYNPEWADELACKECETEYTKDEVRPLL